MTEESQRRLDTCHDDLRKVFMEVDKYIPLQILEGERGQVAQDAAYYAVPQRSKVKWPNSKHNTTKDRPKALAVDAMPLPIEWNNIKKLHFFAGFVMAIAYSMGIDLRWGGDWDGDKILGEPNDDWDKPHFELQKEEEV